DVGEQAPQRREEEQRSELSEVEQPDVGRRTGQLVRVRTEHHVLHPRTDVRCEGPEVDDAEVAVPQRGLRGATLERDVAVDERVFDLLTREGIQLRFLALQHPATLLTGSSAEPRNSADHVLFTKSVELIVADTELVAQHG